VEGWRGGASAGLRRACTGRCRLAAVGPRRAGPLAGLGNAYARLRPTHAPLGRPTPCATGHGPRRGWGRPRGSGGLAQVGAGWPPLARGALVHWPAWATLTPASAPRRPLSEGSRPYVTRAQFRRTHATAFRFQRPPEPGHAESFGCVSCDVVVRAAQVVPPA